MKWLLRFLIIIHTIFVILNISAFFVLPFYTSWFIATPLMTFILGITFSRTWDCPSTRLENAIRARMGLPEIKTFIGYYVVKPVYRKYLRWRRNRE